MRGYQLGNEENKKNDVVLTITGISPNTKKYIGTFKGKLGFSIP